MSRDLIDETYYVSHGGMIPVKWTAPEVCILLYIVLFTWFKMIIYNSNLKPGTEF